MQAATDQPLLALQATQPRVITIDDDGAILRHEGEHFRLGPENPLQIVKKFQMSVADHSKYRHRGASHAGQLCHFSEAGNPHLHYGCLMLRRNAGQGHGNTDLVIQVTLGFQYIQLLTQYCPDHLLGGGLAHTAGNTDHRQAKAFPIGCAKRLQRFLHILHQNHRAGDALRQPLRQTAGGPLLQGCCHKIMAIHPFPFVGNKQVPRRNGPAVDDHTPNFSVIYFHAHQLPAAYPGRLRNGDIHAIISNLVEYTTFPARRQNKSSRSGKK